MKVLAIIPARGGSKGVPKKNLKPLAGLPLIKHTFEFAKSAELFDQIVVSTEDQEISDFAHAEAIGVIRRPAELAADDSVVIDAVRYTLDQLDKTGFNPDVVFLLECTAPFRNLSDLKKAAILLAKENYDCLASFKTCDPPPSRLWSIEENLAKPLLKGSNPFLPRQKQLVGYQLTGEIYAFRKDAFDAQQPEQLIFGKFCPLISSSKYFVDIDAEVDFLIAESILNYENNEKA